MRWHCASRVAPQFTPGKNSRKGPREGQRGRPDLHNCHSRRRFALCPPGSPLISAADSPRCRRSWGRGAAPRQDGVARRLHRLLNDGAARLSCCSGKLDLFLERSEMTSEITVHLYSFKDSGYSIASWTLGIFHCQVPKCILSLVFFRRVSTYIGRHHVGEREIHVELWEDFINLNPVGFDS